jgi:nucleoside phosphorylase
MRNPRAAIITAIPSELEALRQLLPLKDFTDPQDGSVYFKGILACGEERENCAREWEIVLPMPGEAGNVISGVRTNRVINMLDPDVILFVGCAGGIPGKVNPYDVVVGSRIYYYEPGKVDGDFFPRPDLARPTRKLLERANAEIFTDHWLQYLYPAFPNDPPAARVEPIAAGELLIKESGGEHLRSVRAVAPRCIAVEQEGFGVLMAAREAGVEAIVVRGISDMLDDKGADPVEDLEPFNPRQVKAARHAAAFAFAILARFDVSWMRDVDFVGQKDAAVTIKLEGHLHDIHEIEQHLVDLLRDGRLSKITFTSGSIKAHFSVEGGHAAILKAAVETRILDALESHRILEIQVSDEGHSPSSGEAAELLRKVDLDGGVGQASLVELERLASEAPKYGSLIGKVVAAARRRIAIRTRDRAPPSKVIDGPGSIPKPRLYTMSVPISHDFKEQLRHLALEIGEQELGRSSTKFVESALQFYREIHPALHSHSELFSRYIKYVDESGLYRYIKGSGKENRSFRIRVNAEDSVYLARMRNKYGVINRSRCVRLLFPLGIALHTDTLGSFSGSPHFSEWIAHVRNLLDKHDHSRARR